MWSYSELLNHLWICFNGINMVLFWSVPINFLPKAVMLFHRLKCFYFLNLLTCLLQKHWAGGKKLGNLGSVCSSIRQSGQGRAALRREIKQNRKKYSLQLLQFDGFTNNPFLLKVGNFPYPQCNPAKTVEKIRRQMQTEAATLKQRRGIPRVWRRTFAHPGSSPSAWRTGLDFIGPEGSTQLSPGACGSKHPAHLKEKLLLCKENLHDSARRICSTVFAAVVKSCRLVSDQQHTQGACDLFCLLPSSAIRHLTNSHCGVWMRLCAKVSPSKRPRASCFSTRFLPRGVTFTGLCTHSVEQCIVRALRDCSQLRSYAGVSDSKQRAKDCKGRWSVSSGDSGELMTRLFRLTLRLKRTPENIQWWAWGNFRKLSRVQLNRLLSASTYHTISLSRGIGCSGHEGEDAAGGVQLRRIDCQKFVLTFWINTDWTRIGRNQLCELHFWHCAQNVSVLPLLNCCSGTF